jgi:hypothetical protein
VGVGEQQNQQARREEKRRQLSAKLPPALQLNFQVG